MIITMVNIAVNVLLPGIGPAMNRVANRCATANATTRALRGLAISSGPDGTKCSHSTFKFHRASSSNGNYSIHRSILTHSLASIRCGGNHDYRITSNALSSPCANRAVRFMHKIGASSTIRVSRIITLRGT